MKRFRNVTCIGLLAAGLLGIGLLGCSEDTVIDFVCDCGEGEDCNHDGECLPVCETGEDCGGCGTCQLGLCVREAACTFALTLDPSELSLAPGSSNDVGVFITRGENVTSAVTMRPIYSLPPGVTADFDPNFVVGGSTVLTIEVDFSALGGTTELSVRGTSNGFVSGADLTLEIVAPEDGFSLTGSTAGVQAYQGSTLDVPITISRFGAFEDDIVFSIPSPPAGINVEFTPATAGPLDTTVTASLELTGGASPGATTVTIRAENPTATVIRSLDLDFEILAGIAISGTVVDGQGDLIPSATVALNHAFTGGAPTTTGFAGMASEGQYDFDVSPAPYTITVVTPDDQHVLEAQGLTGDDVLLGFMENGAPTFGRQRAAVLSGGVTLSTATPALGAGEHILVAAGGTTITNFATDGAGGFVDESVVWCGPASQTVPLVAFEWSEFPSFAFGSAGVAASFPMNDDDTLTAVSIDIDTTNTITSDAVELSWTPGAYGGTRQADAGVYAFTLNGGRVLPGFASPTAVNPWTAERSPVATAIPTGETATLFASSRRPPVVANTNVDAYQAMHLAPAPAGGGMVNLDLPTSVELWPVVPEDDAVTPHPARWPTFEWSPVTDVSFYMMTIEPETENAGPDFTIIMPPDVNELAMPDYSPLDVDLGSGVVYQWQVIAVRANGYTLADYVAPDTNGFADLFFHDADVEIFFSGHRRFVSTDCIDTNGGVETCDGNDNDCNGVIDDVANPTTDCAAIHTAAADAVGFGCWPDTGACVITRCVAEKVDQNEDPSDGCEADCVITNGGIEICDDVDNDCNGVIDDGFEVGETCGVGQCAGGFTEECDGAGSTQCSTMPGGSHDASSAEVCDGLDNDCNGTIDDVGEVGIDCGCEEGINPPVPEICGNDLDDDCDGEADEGCEDPCDSAAAGGTRCLGDVLYTCDGITWTDAIDCTETAEVCADDGGGTAYCDAPIAPCGEYQDGNTRCSGDDLQTCLNGSWVATTTCGAGLCVDNGDGAAACN